MTTGEVCTHNVVVTREDENLVDAAKRMRMFHVGDLVVVHDGGDKRVPVGILTDRDIVLSAVASEAAHIHSLLVRDVMRSELVTARDHESLMEALKRMQAHGVRRLPIVSDDGALVGILALDDVVRAVSEELDALVSLMAAEHKHEQRFRL